MPFSIRLYRRFPVQCAVTYSAGLISRLRTQRASLFKGITTVVSLGTLAVLVTGCSSAQLDDAGLQSRNRISDQFLNSYDQCLKTYKSEPAKSTYNCYALYGTAAYYRQDYDLALKTLAPSQNSQNLKRNISSDLCTRMDMVCPRILRQPFGGKSCQPSRAMWEQWPR